MRYFSDDILAFGSTAQLSQTDVVITRRLSDA
jgi:hypothetical protein